MTAVKRALISVFDKAGILELAKTLDGFGIELLSTGGTAKLLRENGLKVSDVSDLTGFPEMLDGRVKTLHPFVHGGLLARRGDAKHMQTLKKHGIQTIDLVVVNLYPFWEAVKTAKHESEIIEMIDIGGPAMLRSASKNFESVTVLTDPADYPTILEEIRKTGEVSLKTKRYLAGKVFKLTSFYDQLIADYFSPKELSSEHLPQDIHFNFSKKEDLRYGENPHQRGALYGERFAGNRGILAGKKLQGKELSFNNYLDLDVAYEMVRGFKEPACSIIKHVSPCGFAIGKNTYDAYNRAFACDPLSAFGGIVGINGPVDKKLAQSILKNGFVECLLATDFSAEAMLLFGVKKNLRLLTIPMKATPEKLDYKKVSGGLLVQDLDRQMVREPDLKCVTKAKPSKSQIADLLFAFEVCRFVKSNAIVLARGRATVGLGMGQPSRVDSCITAFRKAGQRSKGSVLASDGFFPKPDSIKLAKKHGIRAIIQPGGSIQDEEVIRACDQAKIAMVCTGVRHFRH